MIDVVYLLKLHPESQEQNTCKVRWQREPESRPTSDGEGHS